MLEVYPNKFHHPYQLLGLRTQLLSLWALKVSRHLPDIYEFSLALRACRF